MCSLKILDTDTGSNMTLSSSTRQMSCPLREFLERFHSRPKILRLGAAGTSFVEVVSDCSSFQCCHFVPLDSETAPVLWSPCFFEDSSQFSLVVDFLRSSPFMYGAFKRFGCRSLMGMCSSMMSDSSFSCSQHTSSMSSKMSKRHVGVHSQQH